jgi:hypothetical protein
VLFPGCEPELALLVGPLLLGDKGEPGDADLVPADEDLVPADEDLVPADEDLVLVDIIDELGVVEPRSSRMTRSVVAHKIGIPSQATYASPSVNVVVNTGEDVSSL